jgi:hypothetical protein
MSELTDGLSPTAILAAEREAHWLACKRILREKPLGSQDYLQRRNLVTEAMKECADLVNYLTALGWIDLADDAVRFGDTILERRDKEENMPSERKGC